jgi:hypothetical protein
MPHALSGVSCDNRHEVSMMRHAQNPVTVEELLDLVRKTPPDRLLPKLRKFVRDRLDTGYPNDQLYADLMGVYDRMSEREDEERGDAVLDVMDFLTGWCAPGARLY